MQILWHLIALFITQPRISAWIIRRAQRTPYTHIPSRDGRGTYMHRWWLFNPYGKDAQGNELPARWRWLPSVRVHHICLPDADRHLHDHPWNARTIVLRGWYDEEFYQSHMNDQAVRERFAQRTGGHALSMVLQSRIRSTGYTGRLLYGQYHRIAAISDGGVWTLFFTWKLRGDWGFDVNGKKVPWRQYLSQQEIAK